MRMPGVIESRKCGASGLDRAQCQDASDLEEKPLTNHKLLLQLEK
jgi:hypothetical protein